jgi:segregation and condensation protein B
MIPHAIRRDTMTDSDPRDPAAADASATPGIAPTGPGAPGAAGAAAGGACELAPIGAEAGDAGEVTAPLPGPSEADLGLKDFALSPPPGRRRGDATPEEIGEAVARLALSMRESFVRHTRVLEATPDRPIEVDAAMRMVEALLFASAQAVEAGALAARLPAGVDAGAALAKLKRLYAGRGVELVEVAGAWRFQTAAGVAEGLREDAPQQKRLSKAALETLAIIAYHQPVTRAEIEDIRGVAVGRGTLDHLMDIGWVRPRGRRRAPGKPLTFGTTQAFLEHFGLAGLEDLPGKADMKAAGLLDARLPPDFAVPRPSDLPQQGELPLEAGEGGVAEFHVDYLQDVDDDAS